MHMILATYSDVHVVAGRKHQAILFSTTLKHNIPYGWNIGDEIGDSSLAREEQRRDPDRRVQLRRGC